MKSFLLRVLYIAVISFIILFDKDGAQLGTILISNVPDYVVAFASVLGNTLWVFGVLLFLGSIALLLPFFNDEAGEKNYKELKKKGVDSIKKIIKPRTFNMVINYIISGLTIGSGFWFSGTAMFLITFSFQAYVSKIKELWEAENGKDVTLKNKLLEDD